MTRQHLRIATRNSPMALAQANTVKAALLQLQPQLSIDIKGFTTKGDKRLDMPLATIGGKGLFTKELERALLDEQADIAVHSVKDMPVHLPAGLIMPVIVKRDNPCDALVSSHYNSLAELPDTAIIGTSSLRRQCQLRALNPTWQLRNLRGNVNTRLHKLDQGQFDAIILGAAGLARLQLHERIQETISPSCMLPAIAQGTIGIECRQADLHTQALIAPLNHAESQACITAERAVNERLQGGCQVPIAAYAEIQQDSLQLQAWVSSLDTKQVLRASIQGPMSHAHALGLELGQDLVDQGALAILQAIYDAQG